MSVLVRGMEMPTDCPYCPLAHWNFKNEFMGCEIAKKHFSTEELYADGRPEFCPLIPVPEHGRLIDAAEITEHKYTTIPSHRKEYADGKPKSDEEIIAFKFGWNYAIDAIVENAPTIIPAEEGE